MSAKMASGASSPQNSTRLIPGNSVAAELVSRARAGDKLAWDELVERYSPLIWSICRRHRLNDEDAGDVGQSVWLHLVNQLDKIRNPAALPGWLVTTTQRECARVLRRVRGIRQVGYVPDVENMPEEQTLTAEQEVLAAERHTALCEALADLPPAWRQLIVMLTADPPVPYAEIGARLGIAVGSIGPTRARCLDRLRNHPAIAALIDADSHRSEFSVRSGN
jgi:RNA polymerase sigma factor (sigma-70 family)